MAWDVDGFVTSLTAASPHTVEAYERDVRQFVSWADRGGCSDVAKLDHATLRRYLGYLTTRGFARPTISRKAAAIRSFLRYLTRQGVLPADPSRNLRSPKGVNRLPRVPRSTTIRARCTWWISASDPRDPETFHLGPLERRARRP